MSYSPFSVYDMRSLSSIRGEEIQEDIDEKEQINNVENFSAELVNAMSKGNVKRNQTTAQQDHYHDEQIPTDPETRVFLYRFHRPLSG